MDGPQGSLNLALTPWHSREEDARFPSCYDKESMPRTDPHLDTQMARMPSLGSLNSGGLPSSFLLLLQSRKRVVAMTTSLLALILVMS